MHSVNLFRYCKGFTYVLNQILLTNWIKFNSAEQGARVLMTPVYTNSTLYLWSEVNSDIKSRIIQVDPQCSKSSIQLNYILIATSKLLLYINWMTIRLTAHLKFMVNYKCMVGLMNDIRFGIKKNINIWSVFSEYFDLINCKQLENSKT